MTKFMINQVGPVAFLIKDPELKNGDAPFYKWLEENGFRHAWHHGRYDVCDWVFVNITNKLYAYGMPGVEIVHALGNHAITIDEFYQIYNIDGLELVVMDRE